VGRSELGQSDIPELTPLDLDLADQLEPELFPPLPALRGADLPS
jgi:hypothetical protein